MNRINSSHHTHGHGTIFVSNKVHESSWPCLRSWRWLPEVSRKDIYGVDRATKLHEVLSTAGDHLSIEKNIAENHVEHGLRHRLTQRNLGRMWLFGG